MFDTDSGAGVIRAELVEVNHVARDLIASIKNTFPVDPGYVDYDAKVPGRKGVFGLELKQRFEDHHCAVLAAWPRTSGSNDATQLGEIRRSCLVLAALRRDTWPGCS